MSCSPVEVGVCGVGVAASSFLQEEKATKANKRRKERIRSFIQLVGRMATDDWLLANISLSDLNGTEEDQGKACVWAVVDMTPFRSRQRRWLPEMLLIHRGSWSLRLKIRRFP